MSGLAPQDLKSTAEIASVNSDSIVRLCKDISIYICIYKHTRTCMYMDICKCMCIYIYTHTYKCGRGTSEKKS